MFNETVGNINYNISIDTKGLVQGSTQIGKSTKGVRDDFRKTSESSKTLNTQLSRVAKSIGAVFAVNKIRSLIVDTATAIDTQNQFSKSIGVSYDALQRLQYATEQHGAATNETNNSLRRLARRVAEAADGTGPAVKAFELLNIEAETLKGLSPDEVFLRVSDAMGDVTDEGEQLRIAFGLFDTEGAKMLNTMRLGSSEIRRLGDEAQRVGRVISDDTAQSAADFNSELVKLKGAAGAVTVALGTEMLPALTSVMDSFTEFLTTGDNVEKIVDGIKIVAGATAVVMTAKFVGAMVASVAAMNKAVVAGRILTGTLALLGGPVGMLAAVAIGMGILAISSADATEKMELQKVQVSELTEEYDKLTEAQKGERIATYEEELAALELKKQQLQIQKEIKEEEAKEPVGSGLGVKQAIAVSDASSIQNEIDNVEDYIKDFETRLAYLRGELEITGNTANEAGDEIIKVIKPTDEVVKVLTTLAERNEELRASLNDTTEAMEIRRAIQAAGVKEGSAEAEVIANLIKGNNELAQAIRDKTEAELAAENLKSEFGSVKEQAEDEGRDEFERLEFELAERMSIINAAHEQELVSEEEFEEARLAIKESYDKRHRDLENQRMVMILSSTAQIFDDLGSLAKTFAGEQSGIFKGLFAISKAFSIAQSIVAIKTGIAQAAAIPFPANLGAMATVAAQTAGIVSSIKGTQMGGGRQYGGATQPGVTYPINESGAPEVWTGADGRSYLTAETRGHVTSSYDLGKNTTQKGGDMFEFNINGGGSMTRSDFVNMLFDSENEIMQIAESARNARGES